MAYEFLTFKNLFILVLIIILILSILEIISFLNLFYISKELSASSKPFSYQKDNTSQRLLFIGDSGAVGTGAKNPNGSVAGHFHNDFPEYEIMNLARNGLKIDEIKESLKEANGEFDLIIINAGANNILYFSSLEDSVKDLDLLLKESKNYSDKIIFLTSGNIGLAPIFPKPVGWFYEKKTKKFLDNFKKVADENKVPVVNLYTKNKNDPILGISDDAYSLDKLHLNEKGYKFWYEKIRETMKENEINLKQV